MYKYLNFFNKKGEYCNFEYDSVNDKWYGRIDFNTVSEGLIEDYQIYVLEQMLDVTTNQVVMGWPHVDSSYLPGPSAPIGPSGATSTAIGVTATFNPKEPVDDIFIYDFELGPTTNILNKYYSYSFEFDFDPSQTLSGSTAEYPGMKESENIRSEALQINVGFQPSDENGYTSHLYLKDSAGHVFADIEIYGEGEEEDERLRDMLINLGIDLLPQDSIIFDTADVNEPETDWILINRKRKELLLEYSNIFPYMGSYKALINVIKYFGYQNVRMKEYWKNVDTQSRNFGKYIKTDIKDIFTENANFNNARLIPSKIYKKTSLFGLYYDITVESGEYDDDGIPIVEEVFPFSPQEILIKIYALKKKLKDYFLPLNARIIDIVGEAVFYAKYDINVWNEQARIDSVTLGLKPKYEVYPSNKGCIEDLRYLSYFGCPVGPDLTLGGTSSLLSWRIGYGSTAFVGGILDGIQYFYADFKIPGPTNNLIVSTIQRNPNTGQTAYSPAEIANSMVRSINNYGPPISNNFLAYQEGGSSGIVRIIQRNPIGNGTIYVGATSSTSSGLVGGIFLPGPTANTFSFLGNTGGTAYSINISPAGSFGSSGAPMSYYGACFLGYFDKMNVPINKLNDDENIPVGSPFILQNKTFNITWDEATVTFDQLDQPNPSMFGSTATTLFSSFTLSNDLIGWTSINSHPDLPEGATYVSIPVGASITGFPYSSYPLFNVFTWNNLGYYGYYEMQWVVSKPKDETPEFYLDSGRLPIDEITNYPIILPYGGKYRVELYLWDGYNNKSSLMTNDVIDVCVPEIDLIGWYQYRERNYTWDTDRYPVQTDYAKWPKENGAPPGPELTWDEYASTWELPQHPNEAMSMADISYNSLDSVEFYQNIVNPSENPLIDRYPYFYNLLENNANWNDSYHLWWDGMGTKITQWEIKGLSGPNASIYMTRGNTILDLNSINVFFDDDPAGYTGATGATSLIGATGDIILSTNQRTYRYNGSTWNYITDVVDSYQATGLSVSSPIATFKDLVKKLNVELPNDTVDHPFLTDFMYYYNEEYDNTFALTPYIRAVSKSFDSAERHKIKMIGGTADEKTYETVNFGYIGDIPTHFEMYGISPIQLGGDIDSSFFSGSSEFLLSAVNPPLQFKIQPDGSIIAAGNITIYNGTAIQRITRILPEGLRDTSFISVSGFNSSVNTIEILSDGKILAGGAFTSWGGGVYTRNRIARLLPSGFIDTTAFTGSGFNGTVNVIKIIPPGLPNAGDILVGGNFTTYNGTSVGRMARLSSSGTLLSTYQGTNGFDGEVRAIEINSSGEVFVGGSFVTFNGITVNRIAKFPSTEFSVTLSAFGFGSKFNNTVNSIAIQSDGKIIVGGSFTTYQGLTANRLIRLNNNSSASADSSFNNIGSGFNNTVTTIAIQSDGKILVGGAFTNLNGTARNRLVRLNYDGTVDTTLSLGSGFNAQVNTIAIQSDGKIVIGGAFTTYKSTSWNGIVRLIGNTTNNSILITGMTAAYSVGATNLINLASELNGTTAQNTPIIGNFEYNIVYGASGLTGSTAPMPALTAVKVQAISKSFKNPEEIEIIYTGSLQGTSYGRSLIKNPDWNGIRILKYAQELPLLTVVNFTYDPAKMWGKKNPRWVLRKENDPDFPDIYFNNRYFSYLFTRKGSYTISLTLEDTNGNERTVTKTELIKIV